MSPGQAQMEKLKKARATVNCCTCMVNLGATLETCAQIAQQNPEEKYGPSSPVQNFAPRDSRVCSMIPVESKSPTITKNQDFPGQEPLSTKHYRESAILAATTKHEYVRPLHMLQLFINCGILIVSRNKHPVKFNNQSKPCVQSLSRDIIKFDVYTH
jgi:hypothetical protein